MSGALKSWANGCTPEIEPEAGARQTGAPEARRARTEARRARADADHTDHSDPGHARCGRDGRRYLDLRLDVVADAVLCGCCRACRLFESPYFAIASHSHGNRLRGEQRDARERGFHAHRRGGQSFNFHDAFSIGSLLLTPGPWA